MLAERAKSNAAEVEKAYGAKIDDEGMPVTIIYLIVVLLANTIDESDGWDGIGEPSGSGKGKGRAEEREEEYEDEEQLATVTVVEEFDPDELIHGPKQPEPADEDEDEDAEENVHPHAKRKLTTPAKLESSKPLAKATTTTKKMQAKKSANPKKIKYQTGSERKIERAKQQKRKVEKATRAGGKGSRKRAGKR